MPQTTEPVAYIQLAPYGATPPAVTNESTARMFSKNTWKCKRSLHPFSKCSIFTILSAAALTAIGALLYQTGLADCQRKQASWKNSGCDRTYNGTASVHPWEINCSDMDDVYYHEPPNKWPAFLNETCKKNLLAW